MTYDMPHIYNVLLTKRYQDDLFADLGPGRREGRDYRTSCPFCHSRDNFSYNADQPVWRCWSPSCGKGGDWIDYIEQRQHVGFRDAARQLADAAGVPIPDVDQQRYRAYKRKAELLELCQTHFSEALLQPEARPWYAYAKQRYSDTDIRNMGLGACVQRAVLLHTLSQQNHSSADLDAAGLTEQWWTGERRITIPLRDQAGRIIGFTGRLLTDDRATLKALEGRGEPKYRNTKGTQLTQTVTGLQHARGHKSALLVEGYLDALYLNQRPGMETVTRVIGLGGTTLSADQLQAIQTAGINELFVCMDQDEAGQDATERIVQTLTRNTRIQPQIVELEGAKDPDELVRRTGPVLLAEAIDAAVHWSQWLTERIISQEANGQELTPRISERILARASELYSATTDAISRQAIRQILSETLWIEPGAVLQRLSEAADIAQGEKDKTQLLQELQSIQGRLQDGSWSDAEDMLSSALQRVRSRHSVQLEPYSADRMLQGLLNTPEGMDTGYKALSSARIPAGALTIIGGRPGHGKTTLQLNLLVNLLQRYPDKRFVLFSYEEAAHWLALKMVMILSGKTLHAATNQGAYVHYLRERRSTAPDRDIEAALQQFQTWTASGRLYLADTTWSVEDLTATIGNLCAHGAMGAVFVDYIQKISPRKAESVPYVRIQRVSEQLREAAVRQNIPIILGAQFGRSSEKGSGRVRLDNLRESGDIEQDANLVLGLYTEAVETTEDTGKAEPRDTVPMDVSVLKHRGGRTGVKATLEFNRPTLTIRDSK